MTSERVSGRQDLRTFLERASAERPDDVVVVDQTVDPDQGVTAIVEALRRRGLSPIVVCRSVDGLDVPVVTNVFVSRERIAWMLGGGPHDLHEAYRRGSAGATPPRDVQTGPILDHVTTSGIDLRTLPMLRHFDEDAAPYLTSAIVVAEDPDTGIGNLSYHRCMVSSDGGLATSLHSRGHLWRYLRRAGELGRPLPVAVVIGGHPLFMLAASARAGVDVDERDLAGGLFGEPLEVIRTPQHGIGVPAAAEIVLEGTIDAEIRVEEGPFGEYSGYASHRSTNNLIHVSAILRREDPMLLDVVSGNAADHLNLGRVPREAELAGSLKVRFPDLAAIEYPASGTHFHCFASLGGGATGQARQLLLALLGMDPYMKLAVAWTTTWTCGARTRSGGRSRPGSRPTGISSSSRACPAVCSTLRATRASRRGWDSTRRAVRSRHRASRSVTRHSGRPRICSATEGRRPPAAGPFPRSNVRRRPAAGSSRR